MRDIFLKQLAQTSYREWKQLVQEDLAAHGKKMFAHISRSDKDFLNIDAAKSYGHMNCQNAFLNDQRDIWAKLWQSETKGVVLSKTFQHLHTSINSAKTFSTTKPIKPMSNTTTNTHQHL